MLDSIYALATGSLPCAVAVVRVSGVAAGSVCERLVGSIPPARFAAYRRVFDPSTGELIDNGLVLFFAGPRSFTGEDCVEFQVHGSRAVVARLLRVLGREPAMRLAQPGEFVRRAFENGRLPLTSVEGLADLIDARTEAQLRQALAQAGGHLADRVGLWRGQLLDCLALLSAEIDFADEGDAPSGTLPIVKEKVSLLLADLDRAIADAGRGEQIRSGLRVVIAGPPNAGKSSLMNHLVRREAAIVSDHPGTTRDLINVDLDIGGIAVTLSDTAGIRATDNPVELIGIDRALSAVHNASVVLWLFDVLGPAPDALPELSCPSIIVGSKLDLSAGLPDWADLGVSTTIAGGLDELLHRLEVIVSGLAAGEPTLVTNERQLLCVASAARSLRRALEVDALELVAEDLRACSSQLEILLGRLNTDDVLGAVFSRFCMGK